MKSFLIKCETPLPLNGGKYKGFAFDGCYFYLTCPARCEIIKYDTCFCEIARFKTGKPYTCLCFDWKSNCFWAATHQTPYKLFKLDTCFCEIDCVTLSCCDTCGASITGISYNCLENGLMLSFANSLLFVDPCDPSRTEVLQRSCSAWNTGILSVSPSYVLTRMEEGKQSLVVYDCHGEPKAQIDLPPDCLIEAVVFYPCKTHLHEKCHFYALASKKGTYSYLLECDLYCRELEISYCNFSVCNRKCETRPCSAHACVDVIESVALIETALSHILNAEGEKLQKVIAGTDDIDQILCVNKAVSQTVVDVTHLEIILHDKLMALKEICGSCDDPCPYQCPCQEEWR